MAFKNKEFVFGRNSSQVKGNTKISFPIQFGGWNGYCIPQKIIDKFKMVDGRNINNSSTMYPYDETSFTTTDISFSGYTIKPRVNNMYVNRESRFYASIGYSGCLWTMNSTTENGKFMQQVFYSIALRIRTHL